MHKKVRKLVKSPKLFFADMIRKRITRRNEFKIINVVQSRMLNKTYNIILIASPSTVNVIKWIEKISLNFIKFRGNVNIVVLNAGINTEDREIINNNGSGIKIYDISSEEDYYYFTMEIVFEFSIFLWGNDFVDINYLYVIDKFLSSVLNYRQESVIVFTPVMSNNGVIDANSLFLKRLAKNRLAWHQTVYDCLYGKVVSTKVLLSAFEQNNIFPCLDYNGVMVLNDVISQSADCINIYYLDSAVYKQESNNQTTPSRNSPWDDPELYGDKFSHMINRLGNQIESFPHLQMVLQKVLLCIIVKYAKKGMTNQSLLDGLKPDVREKFIETFNYAINLVGHKCVHEYNISLAEHLKIGLYNLQNSKSISKTIELIQVDKDKQQILLRYYSTSVDDEIYIYNKQALVPVIDKYISYMLFGHLYYYERRVWLQLDKSRPDASLSVFLNGTRFKLKGQDKKLYDEVTYRQVMAVHGKSEFRFTTTEKYRYSWILMDRDNQADDNAEHLYRYLQENRQDIDAWFVINRSSHDWDRLASDGFRLLEFGSKEHEKALMSCSRVISSHAAQFATDYFKDKRMIWKKFIFLQHGVIHNDQSALFRPDWKKFDLFLTSATDEYHSLVNDFGGYKFTAKEVALTGLPRHDALVKSQTETEKMILVMPTWRPALLGKVISGTKRELLDDFSSSEYAMTWSELLNDPKLIKHASDNGYRIVFFPHANIQPYLEEYTLPEHVEVMSHASGSIQELFLKAAMMVTDYSSVAFEMAYLNKPVCYYQFDEDSFFLAGHYNKGYFNYRDNGFGPVSTYKEDIIDFVINSVNAGCKMTSPYAQRANEFFPYRDGKCCERVVHTIESLDAPEIDDHLLISAGVNKGNKRTLQWAEKLSQRGSYLSAIRYFNNIKEDVLSTQEFKDQTYHEFYIDSLIMRGDVGKALLFLNTQQAPDESVHERLLDRHDIVSSILFDMKLSDFSIRVENYDSYIYRRLFSYDHESLNMTDFDYAELAQSIHQQAQDSVVSDEMSDKNAFTLDTITLKLHELSGDYAGLIQVCESMEATTRDSIIVKYLYLCALFKLNKWSKIYDFIGNNRILQGRTGITRFAVCYFMGARGFRKKVARVNDYQYLLKEIQSLPDDCVLEVLKYYLYIEDDIKSSLSIVEVFYNQIPARYIEDLSFKLCESNNSEVAYKYLSHADVKNMSLKSLKLLGGMAMAYGNYELAVDSFRQAYLNCLPVSDTDLFVKLSMARALAENKNPLLVSHVN